MTTSPPPKCLDTQRHLGSKPAHTEASPFKPDEGLSMNFHLFQTWRASRPHWQKCRHQSHRNERKPLTGPEHQEPCATRASDRFPVSSSLIYGNMETRSPMRVASRATRMPCTKGNLSASCLQKSSCEAAKARQSRYSSSVSQPPAIALALYFETVPFETSSAAAISPPELWSPDRTASRKTLRFSGNGLSEVTQRLLSSSSINPAVKERTSSPRLGLHLWHSKVKAKDAPCNAVSGFFSPQRTSRGASSFELPLNDSEPPIPFRS